MGGYGILSANAPYSYSFSTPSGEEFVEKLPNLLKYGAF